MEIVSIILNFILASGLLGTLLFFRSKRRKEEAEADAAEIDNTEKIVAIQSEHITRLDGRVEKLEEKVDKLEIIIEHKDVEIDRSRIVIRQAYKCEIPPEKCPVLIKRQKLIEQDQAERTAEIVVQAETPNQGYPMDKGGAVPPTSFKRRRIKRQ